MYHLCRASSCKIAGIGLTMCGFVFHPRIFVFYCILLLDPEVVLTAADGSITVVAARDTHGFVREEQAEGASSQPYNCGEAPSAQGVYKALSPLLHFGEVPIGWHVSRYNSYTIVQLLCPREPDAACCLPGTRALLSATFSSEPL